MRAVRYAEHGGPEVLSVEEVDRPKPGHGDLLVRVEAAGVNPVDTYFREGEYPVPELPWTPGSDAAGVVETVGPGVEGFEVGDRVFATGLGNWNQGTCAEYVRVPSDHAAVLPVGCSFEEGAALGLVGVTAWQALVHHAELEPAESVLIHSGSGGVGHVAVQLAAATGAEVTTTASPPYHDTLRALGADTVLDYTRADLAEAITAAGAPDVILDTFANEYAELDFEVAAERGRVVAIGNTGPTAPVPMGPGKFKDLRFQVMSMFNTPDTGAVLARLGTLLAAGRVVPEVARTYPLAETPDAHRAVLEESFLGKLVVIPGE
ncbi:NADPH:quinone reductase [Salinirubellus salinus]|uniref:NADPH:quinone reductase n=1 Tax=Salinirubellus salinus TaxID=1364945 RepID=A0A9E7R573_9EURY|nr:NADPH:quinone reductase [Salinirubellus salinus]UWM56105.1 NADPH:quinone reductase [Salinirubellus salinus]